MNQAESGLQPTFPPPSDAPAGGEPHPHGHHRHKSPMETPMLTLFGVLVVWSSLVIIFTANRLSETYMHADIGSIANINHKNAMFMSLDPQVKILLPFSTFVPRMTRAEALKIVGSYVNFNIQDEGLDKLDTRRQTFRFMDSTVFAVIHHLIDKPNLGFTLLNNNLSLFEQTLDTRQPAPGKTEMKWEADLPLTSQRLLVVPSGTLPIWLALRLTGESNEDAAHWNGIQVEVHNGPNTLTVSRAMLDDKGHAELTLTDSQTITLKVQRLTQPGAKTQPRFHFNFFYQATE